MRISERKLLRGRLSARKLLRGRLDKLCCEGTYQKGGWKSNVIKKLIHCWKIGINCMGRLRIKRWIDLEQKSHQKVSWNRLTRVSWWPFGRRMGVQLQCVLVGFGLRRHRTSWWYWFSNKIDKKWSYVNQILRGHRKDSQLCKSNRRSHHKDVRNYANKIWGVIENSTVLHKSNLRSR